MTLTCDLTEKFRRYPAELSKMIKTSCLQAMQIRELKSSVEVQDLFALQRYFKHPISSIKLDLKVFNIYINTCQVVISI